MITLAFATRATWCASLVAITFVGCERQAAGGGRTASATAAPSGASTAAEQSVAITVTGKGYEPTEVHLEAGRPAVLVFTRVTDSECLNAVKMPWMKDAVPLPMNVPVRIPVDTSAAGTFAYSCWMSMIYGRVVIDALHP